MGVVLQTSIHDADPAYALSFYLCFGIAVLLSLLTTTVALFAAAKTKNCLRSLAEQIFQMKINGVLTQKLLGRESTSYSDMRRPTSTFDSEIRYEVREVVTRYTHTVRVRMTQQETPKSRPQDESLCIAAQRQQISTNARI